MNIKKTTFVTVALAALGGRLAFACGRRSIGQADLLTFSQPVSIPGKVLPAGTYTFQLFDSASDRHLRANLQSKGHTVARHNQGDARPPAHGDGRHRGRVR